MEGFSKAFGGELLDASSPQYDTVRAIWNGMIDRKPALIARCRDAQDVQAAVRFAREHELLIAIRGGGHNIAGNATCDGGMVIDLSAMRDVHVDVSTKTARVGPGCTLADVDAATQVHGLALPVGVNSTTGIAGLTLGGGFGWLSRSFGLASDNLIAAEVVTADAKRIRVDESNHADLLWAIRGGGGNFGVVTSFEFRLHPVGPEVLAGLIVHPFENAGAVLRTWRDALASAPDELSVWIVIRKAPPLPFLPEEWHGREVVLMAVCYVGADHSAGQRALEPFRAAGKPIADAIGPAPFVAWQQAFDPLLAPGSRNYWKSQSFTEMSDEAIDVACDYATRLPDPQCEVFLAQLGGAMNRIAPDATAYADRESSVIMNVHARWEDPSLDQACVNWARSLCDAMAPHASGAVYVNFLTHDESDRVRNAYGKNLQRLAEVKERWDPDNRFRVNQNITAKSAASA
jgi:FAD/FMN-containing dehydrogenase